MKFHKIYWNFRINFQQGGTRARSRSRNLPRVGIISSKDQRQASSHLGLMEGCINQELSGVSFLPAAPFHVNFLCESSRPMKLRITTLEWSIFAMELLIWYCEDEGGDHGACAAINQILRRFTLPTNTRSSTINNNKCHGITPPILAAGREQDISKENRTTG